ncbi:hypothetical protein GGR52DRAFT_584061 [Hypoxylon sp. FL1284]|nr:hypothetical protein GGR52DRAFT_584061 [Hypoxylon sp. FL1284]
MVVQLLDEVVGTAVGVLFWSFFCLAASCIMIWLVWTHHERDSYVALLSFLSLLGTVTSIVQQFHTLVWWRNIKVEQYEHTITHLDSPEVAIAGASVGLDLVLFYIRKSRAILIHENYTYNAEAMLTLFWAIALTRTVFKLSNLAPYRHMRRRTGQLARGIAIVLPAILMALLRLDAVQKSFIAFLILANFNMMISLTFGTVLLMAILGKYIWTRHQLLSWNARYLFSRREHEVDGEIINVLDRGDGTRRATYDRWLVLRFSIGFVVLAVFQLITILSEVSQLSNHTKEKLGDAPDLSAGKAKHDFLLFMPGVSTSLLVFIVFGTTRTFRKTMYKTFIPKRLQTHSSESEMGADTAPHGNMRDEEEPSRGLHETGIGRSADAGPKTVNDEIEATPASQRREEPKTTLKEPCCEIKQES